MTAGTQEKRVSARERILEAADELFSRQGVRAVGIDAIIERSGVARMTLYRHFPSKDALVLAFLERRENLWTKDWLSARWSGAPTIRGARLLAIFDTFDAWFRSEDFEGCWFINVLLEFSEPSDPINRQAATISPAFAASSRNSPQPPPSPTPRHSRASGTS